MEKARVFIGTSPRTYDNCNLLRLGVGFIILLVWLCCSSQAHANTLTRVELSEGKDFSRLTFSFKEPLGSYVVRRNNVDSLLVELGPIKKAAFKDISEGKNLIHSVEMKTVEGDLTALVKMAPIRYEVRHSINKNRNLLVVDIKKSPEQSTLPPTSAQGTKPLKIPTLPELAQDLKNILTQSTTTPNGDAKTTRTKDKTNQASNSEGQANNLLQRILSRLITSDIPGALEDLTLFQELFPQHPNKEYVGYLKAEAEFVSGPPSETYAAATASWKAALEEYPNSILGPRGSFMLAEADRAMGHINEAAARFKNLSTKALTSEDIYAQTALLRAADLLMGMGLDEEAWGVLEPVLAKEENNRLGLEVYARSGTSNFYQGFYSQANEIFHDVLRLEPNIYQSYPEMLYAMGEGYHYLDRPDLSRMFLMHALNVMPKHPKADVMMARIGENYRKEGQDNEAMAIYGAASRNFPNGNGGLISQMRLADMGALHSFFSQDKVFDGLARGSRNATVEMYKKIVEGGSYSPLMQLAQLRIGTALAEEGEASEAIDWLKELEFKNPNSTLLPEALPILAQSLNNEFSLRAELDNWAGITNLYVDNSSYINPENLLEIQQLVAIAYEKQSLFGDALNIWKDLKAVTPEIKLKRAKSLVVNSYNGEKYLDALKYVLEMEDEFPEEKAWLDMQLTKIGQALARPNNAQATANLYRMVSVIDTEPVRLNALADAIEIEINGQRYERAMELMDQYRRSYPDDKLTPEYILIQAKIDAHEKRYDESWNYLAEFRDLYPDDPRVPKMLLDQIEQAENLGRVDDVFRFMELYRQLQPDSNSGRSMLEARLDREWNMGRYQDAQNSLDKYLRDYQDDPSTVDVLIKSAKRDWDQKRYEPAQQAADHLLTKYPDNPKTIDFLIDLAQREWKAGRYLEARAVADKIIAQYPKDPKTFDFLADLTNREWGQKRYADADVVLAELLKLYPKDTRVADLLIKRSEENWKSGQGTKAKKNWADFRANFPNDPRVERSYLDQYRQAVAGGKVEEAFKLSDQFQETLPQNSTARPDLILERAKDYLSLGQTQKGMKLWDEFRQKYPNDPRTPELLLLLARQEMKMNLKPAAINHYREFIRKYPANPRTADVYLEAAAAETALGRKQEGWELLDRFRVLFPQHSGRADALLEQARMGAELGHNAESIKLFNIFRNDYPDSPKVVSTYLPQARLEIANSNPLGAIAILESGVLARPELDENKDVQALLTDLYLETGQVEEWAGIVEKNLGRSDRSNLPELFMQYQKLAQVYDQLGQIEAAERNFDSALANRPPDATPETIYDIAGAYKKFLRTDKYISTLKLVRDLGDPFWQQIAQDELAAAGAQ